MVSRWAILCGLGSRLAIPLDDRKQHYAQAGELHYVKLMIPMLRYMIYILDALSCLLIILSKYPCIFKSMSFSVDMDTNWQNHEFCRGCWRAYRSKFPDRTRAVLGSPLLFPLKTSLGLRHSLPRT